MTAAYNELNEKKIEMNQSDLNKLSSHLRNAKLHLDQVISIPNRQSMSAVMLLDEELFQCSLIINTINSPE
jgi:hypothetical protein